MQRTLVLLKPDCVQRRLMGEVLSRFEQKGLNVIAMKMMRVTPDLAKQHYAEHVEKPFYPGLEAFITGGPIVAMILEGLEAIEVVRNMLGATNGIKAAAGTIRGDLSMSTQCNIIHTSEDNLVAAEEIDRFFMERVAEFGVYLPWWIKYGRN